MGSSLHKGPAEEPGGGLFTGTRERENAYTSSFSWTQRTLNVKVWGPSGTLARNRAALS